MLIIVFYLFINLAFACSISTDKQNYCKGEMVNFNYYVNQECDVNVKLISPSGQDVIHSERATAGNHQFPGQAWEPLGTRTAILEANGAECARTTYNIVDCTPQPTCDQLTCQSRSGPAGQVTENGVTYQVYNQCSCINNNCECNPVKTPITPTCTGTVSGHVYNTNDNLPISGATLLICPSGGDCWSPAPADSTGFYNSGGQTCPSTSYEITCSAEGYKPSILTQITDETGNARRDIYLEPENKCTGTISGVVTNSQNNKPIDGASLLICQGENCWSPAPTDAKGHFSSSGTSCPSISTEITISAEGYKSDVQKVTTNADGDSLDALFALEPDCQGTISGKVVDASNSQPVADANLLICQNRNCLEPVVTDSSGQYLSKGFCPSTKFDITCSAEGYKPREDTADTDDKGNSVGEIRLEPESKSKDIRFEATFYRGVAPMGFAVYYFKVDKVLEGQDVPIGDPVGVDIYDDTKPLGQGGSADTLQEGDKAEVYAHINMDKGKWNDGYETAWPASITEDKKYYIKKINIGSAPEVNMIAKSTYGRKGVTFVVPVIIKNPGTKEDNIKIELFNEDTKLVDASLSENNMKLAAKELKILKLTIKYKDDLEKFVDVTVKASSEIDANKYNDDYLRIFQSRENNPLLFIIDFVNFDGNKHKLSFTTENDYIKLSNYELDLGNSKNIIQPLNLVFDLTRKSSDKKDSTISIIDSQMAKTPFDISIILGTELKITATDFDISKHGYRFKNWGDPIPIPIPWLNYPGGHCYGMAKTSILYYNYWMGLTPSKIPPDLKGTTNDLKFDDQNVIKYIVLSQSTQKITETFTILIAYIDDEQEYNNLKAKINSNEPVLLNMLFAGDLSTGSLLNYGHTVVAYKMIETANKDYFSVYDNNYPYGCADFIDTYPVIIFDKGPREFDYSVGDLMRLKTDTL